MRVNNTVVGEYLLIVNKTKKIDGVINKKRAIIYFSAGLLKLCKTALLTTFTMF